MKEYNKIFKRMLLERYYTSKELLYDTKVNILLSYYEYQELLKYKDELIENNSTDIIKLNLKSFNGGCIHFSKAFELTALQGEYYKIIINDALRTSQVLSIRHMDDITRSRIYSEVEGTLNTESIPTTRKAIDDFSRGKRDPKTLNDQIILNMIKGIEFVNTLPEFNKDNLFKLYNILSNGCLSKEDELLANNYYRHDGVEVGTYTGCPVNKIDECLNSLFEFVNSNLSNNNNDIFMLLPHIAHYYILYIHPYFDYNGRTARMVSYWISLLTNGKIVPPIVSEAINQTKNLYYYSLSETRDTHNDLTYFLIYIYDISIKYMLTYLNIEEISSILKNQNNILTALEKNYLKKILISCKGKFTHTDFIKWIGVNMSKQGAFKILNTFEKYNILVSTITNTKKKQFTVNKEMIKYLAL